MKLFKISEIAKKAGVTIRTLHHYDQVSLLKPSNVSKTGHRLYNVSDIERLQQILFLKSIGFSLEDIARCLTGTKASLLETFRVQEQMLSQRLADLKGVYNRLQLMLKRFEHRENPSEQDLLNLIKEMNEMEQFYTPQQLKKLQERYEKYPDQVKEVEKAWPILFKQFEDALDQGIDPQAQEVQELAKKAQHFIDLFTGGDKAIEANLDKNYEQNKERSLKTWGVSERVFAYATKARKIFNEKKASAK